MRSAAFSLAAAAIIFSALAAANVADSSSSSVGELSAPQIEDELQVLTPIIQSGRANSIRNALWWSP
jgi:hypothetical protein